MTAEQGSPLPAQSDDHDAQFSIDTQEFRAQLKTAFDVRADLYQPASQTAYRLFHGYAEGAPGLTIDRFGESILIVEKRSYAGQHEMIRNLLQEYFSPNIIGIKTQRKGNRNPTAERMHYLVGQAPTAPLQVLDSGMSFWVEPFANDNPGLFLDARPVRNWLLENSRQRRVLNLFAYTGSLGISAAIGGATQVLHMDQKNSPLKRAQENHRLNSLPVDPRSFLKGDVYYHLPRAAKSGVQYDGIILDPPPVLPQKKRRRPKGQDYPKLIELCAPLLAPQGWLLCFFHRRELSRSESEQQVSAACPFPLEIIHRGTSGLDFPEQNADEKLRLTVFQRN